VQFDAIGSQYFLGVNALLEYFVPVQLLSLKVDIIAALLNDSAGRDLVTKARIIRALLKRELFCDPHRIDHFSITDRACGTVSNYSVLDAYVPSNLRFTAHEPAILTERV